MNNLVHGPKRFFGGKKTENIIHKGRCWSHKTEEACGSKNTYIKGIRRTETHILYNVVCNDCGYVQNLAMNRYKLNNFLKV